MATKKDAQREAIYKHGVQLKEIFGIPFDGISAVELATKLHRLEAKAHRYAEDECNGVTDLTDEQMEARDKRILDAVDKLTGFRAKGIPVFLNGDPRGHALKIDDKWMREHNAELHRDWGGYGILAPEF